MADAAPLALMVIALIALIVARALMAAARDHVRSRHADWYAALGRGGSPFRLGGPDERARRRLIGPLLLGPLPEAAATDPVLKRLADHLRLSFIAAGLAIGGFVLILVLRAQLAAA